MLAIDFDHDVLVIGLTNLSIELVADDQPDLILRWVDFQAGGRLGKPDDLNLTEVAGKARGCRARTRCGGRDPDGVERPRWRLAVGEFFAVHRDLGLLGAEPEGQTVPAGRTSESLHRQRGPSGDSTARLSSAQPSRIRSVAGPVGPRNVRSSVQR